MIEVRDDGGGVLLGVKVVPGASRTGYTGPWQRRAKIVVAAAPEKGKANEALRRYLAKLLGVRRQDVTVVCGQTTALKTIRIDGVTVAAVLAALSPDRS